MFIIYQNWCVNVIKKFSNVGKKLALWRPTIMLCSYSVSCWNVTLFPRRGIVTSLITFIISILPQTTLNITLLLPNLYEVLAAIYKILLSTLKHSDFEILIVCIFTQCISLRKHFSLFMPFVHSVACLTKTRICI